MFLINASISPVNVRIPYTDRVFIITRFDKYRLSYKRQGDISFIARGTISYFVTSERSERGTKYDIVTRAIKLTLPSLECDNLFITYLCLHLEQNSAYIFKLFIRYHGTKNDITGQKTISRDEKRYHGTKNDITGQKTISRDKKRYYRAYRFYVTMLSP